MSIPRVLTSALFILLATISATACVCTFVHPSDGFDQAGAVFTGKVVESSKSRWKGEVIRVWKGEVGTKVKLFDAHAGSSCSSSRSFKKGATYLFLVNAKEKDGTTEYSPQVCNWTTRLNATRVAFDDHTMTFDDKRPGRLAEDLVLLNRGPGFPPNPTTQKSN